MADWTQAQIDALSAAIARGVLTVAFGTRTVTYQSLSEMRALLADMKRQIGTAPASRVAAYSKGV